MSFYSAEAPSNIALIKYMGKKTGERKNLPVNASFSLSLPLLKSKVVITKHNNSSTHEDSWEALNEGEWNCAALSSTGYRKFLSHFQFLKEQFQIPGHYLISSGNNFPADCGVASSASSFAALTLATYELAKSVNGELDLNLNQLANLSRQGSGSSCRSLFSYLCEWNQEAVAEYSEDTFHLKHQVVLVSSGKKAVSSSEAHQRVCSSLNFQGRVERAQARLSELKSSLKQQDWKMGFQLCWEEFWDMHDLFHTSRPTFSYMMPETLQVLKCVQDIWQSEGDGPWVTMDAGPNVHLLYRDDQCSLKHKISKKLEAYRILEGIE